jgi:hypothetical protein
MSAAKKLKIRIYKTIILSAVLYGCETWSLTLREVQGAEEDIWIEEGEWRKLHNEELRDLYSSSSIIRIIK